MTPPEKVIVVLAPDLARRVADRTTVGGDHTLVADVVRAALDTDREALVERIEAAIVREIGVVAPAQGVFDAAHSVLAALEGEGETNDRG